MSTLMLEPIELLCTYKIMMLRILIVLELNILQKRLEHLLVIKTIKTSLFRIQAYVWIICRYFCIGFIDFMLARKALTEFKNLSPPNNFKK